MAGLESCSVLRRVHIAHAFTHRLTTAWKDHLSFPFPPPPLLPPPGFSCRCGGLFCSTHRYSDKHECSFDYKKAGREEIERNNPVVVAPKIQKLWRVPLCLSVAAWFMRFCVTYHTYIVINSILWVLCLASFNWLLACGKWLITLIVFLVASIYSHWVGHCRANRIIVIM